MSIFFSKFQKRKRNKKTLRRNNARTVKESSSDSETESASDSQNWKPVSDSDSSLNTTKKSVKKKSKVIESDSEDGKNLETGKSDESKHNQLTNGLDDQGKQADKDSDSDTDVYIPVSNRKRHRVIESDDDSTDSYTPPTDTPKDTKSSSPAVSNKSALSVELLDKRRPIVLIRRCNINNIAGLTKNINVTIPKSSEIKAGSLGTSANCDKTDSGRTTRLNANKRTVTKALSDLPKTVDYGSDSSKESWMLSDTESSSAEISSSESDSGSSWTPRKITKRKRRKKTGLSKFKESRKKWLQKKAKKLR